MELAQYLGVFRQYWRSVLATMLAVIALTAGFTLLQKPKFSSASAVFLTVESGGSAGELSQGATYAERQVLSYANVATQAIVLDPVIKKLGLEITPKKLAEELDVTTPVATSVINIAATDGSAEGAALLANTVAESLRDAVRELSPPGPDGSPLVSATVINQAVVPDRPSSPRPAVNLALGGVLGLMIGLGQALLRKILDTRLRTSEDLQQLSDAPLLGTIGQVGTTPERQVLEGEHWAAAEAYRRLRTNVGFVGLGGERRPSIVFTSATQGEGKTETSVNLARVLAQTGKTVLLVDADMRRPQVAKRMGVDSELGLSDVLTGRGSLTELVITVAPNLTVLPAGTSPPNPSELLGSEAMAQLVATVERQFDYVLFDSPPLLPVTDAVVLASQTAGAVVVARSGVVLRQEFQAALTLLAAGEVTLLGMVLNDAPPGADGSIGGENVYYHRRGEETSSDVEIHGTEHATIGRVAGKGKSKSW